MIDLVQALAEAARYVRDHTADSVAHLKLDDALAAFEAGREVREAEMDTLESVAYWYRGADMSDVPRLERSYLALLAAREKLQP